ncbi:insulin receptor substrate 2-like [Hemiscyllium ocellatum]|uniref:insulin receptor substrate 2-like n=1 Tax=Hemiscyllium ocellatum TaxID=170820 RepID=UPI002966F0C0|nr:insulin receptor substrate 2-like [Hemiscyllium ocellatum]
MLFCCTASQCVCVCYLQLPLPLWYRQRERERDRGRENREEQEPAAAGVVVGKMASPPVLKAGVGGHLCFPKVKKCGYLKKQKHGHKRFFVLRERSGDCPARLEYYENEKKWRNKSAAKRVIPLESCLNINKRADAKHKYLIALYTKDEYLAVAADSEQEQESWFHALTELLSQDQLLQHDQVGYGLLTPASALYKEVWQVNLKPKGLGQAKNLTGFYMLCLSSKSMGFVKLNSQVPSVNLQLMNIRRCGHSENFFFMEVGRSASTGPGELWMQVDDSVVAQHIHETILEAMKAMKELCEFRPRSKSQSSGSNPISVPTRRHLNNLPPSQTGLQRRSRTDSVNAPLTANKITSCRMRTASEGDSTMCRPESMTRSPISPSMVRTHFSRSSTMSRNSRVIPHSSLHHSRSMSMPMSHSPPSATSPVSLSSSSGHGSASDTIPRPSSGSASVSGSPSDGGFISFDEYGSSPGDLRHYVGNRSNTPESLTETPPVREGSELYGYMLMERHSAGHFNAGCYQTARDESAELEKSYRKRTYSLTTPCRQKATSQVSSVSLDEYTLMKATCMGSSGRLSHTASPKVAYNPYPEDYCDIEIGSQRSSGSTNLGDDGYMPMTPGVAPAPNKSDEYMPMSPKSISAPKQIINPRSHSQVNANGYKNISPTGSCSPDPSGYMRMWCGSKLSVESSDGKFNHDEYMNMSPIDCCASVTPPDYFFNPVGDGVPKPSYSFHSLPRSYKPQCQKNGENDHYVLMNSPGSVILEEPTFNAKSGTPCAVSHASRSPGRQSQTDSLVSRGRAMRPTRLSLDKLRASTLPSTNEHPLPPEPKSPGEYINIDFNNKFVYSPPAVSLQSSLSSKECGNAQRKSAVSDYMNLDLNSQSPKSGVVPCGSFDSVSGSSVACSSINHPADIYLKGQVGTSRLPNPLEDEADYTDMTFGMATTAPLSVSPKHESIQVASPTTGVKRLSLIDQMPPVEVFMLPSLPPDPNRGAKVIRADPQGRRRHSSETFSSTTTVTPVSPSFAHDPKRHSSASFENVSLRKNDEAEEEQGSPMCRKTSTGFQNGLNYIALDLMDDDLTRCEKLIRCRSTPQAKGSINGSDASTYARIDFVSKNLDRAAAVED